jgi:hypothetical protein
MGQSELGNERRTRLPVAGLWYSDLDFSLLLFFPLLLTPNVAAAIGTDARPSHQSFIGPKYQVFGAPAETATSTFTADADSMRALWEISTIKTGAEWSI